jgi:phosphomethylpyrimidine synthase
MKISQDVRDYAKANGLDEQSAVDQGMKEMSVQFVQQGSKLYQEA